MRDSDYYNYQRGVVGKKRRRLAAVVTVLVAAALFAAAGVYWYMHTHRAVPAQADATQSEPPAAEPAQATPEQTQPTPEPDPEPAQDSMRLLPAIANEAWDKSEPVEQTIDLEYLNTDFRMVGLPELGEVSTGYFDTVTFLGDSIASGLGIYSTGLRNAKYCAYVGAGPQVVVNNAVTKENAVTHVAGETPMDALVATQPDYVYILFGTNSLVQPGTEDQFLAYYERMIDLMRENLNPGVIFYIQAIPGVQEDVVASKPGLDNARIRTVNNLLANLALRKGCYFINTQEALSNPDGSMIDEYDANYDGIHFNPEGYGVWSKYLATHTAWNRRTLYQSENPYYILGT
ncbi:MAG: GDSL-type esterase/lipase family protein [Gemmiger sp.]